MMPSQLRKSVSVGDWRVRQYMLEPKRKLLEASVENEDKTLDENPVISVFLSGGDDTESGNASQWTVPYYIRQSDFESVGGYPALALKRHFMKSSACTITLTERWEDFEIVADFMICKVIDLRKVPLDFLFVADRLMLEPLFNAMLVHVENMALVRSDQPEVPFLPTAEFLTKFLPVLEHLPVHNRFKRHYAIRLVCEHDEWKGESRDQFFSYRKFVCGSDIDELVPVDPWVIFWKNGMLKDIVWYLTNVGKRNFRVVKDIVTQLFRVGELLDDKGFEEVLEELDWCSPQVRESFTLLRGVSYRVRQLGRKYFCGARKENEAVEVLSEVRDFREFRTLLRRGDQDYSIGEDREARGYIVRLRVSMKSRVRVRVTVLENEVDDYWLKDLRVQVRAFEPKCTCDVGGCVDDIKRYEGICVESEAMEMQDALVKGVNLLVMDAFTSRRWADFHGDGCVLRFVVTVRLHGL